MLATRAGLAALLLLAGGALPARAQGDLQLLRGSLHDHTAEGGDDGKGSVAEALAAGKAAGFDFFALTPHDHMIQDSTYESLQAQVRAAEEPGVFLPLAGYEWGTISKGGHVGVLGAARVSRAGSTAWDRFYQDMEADPGDPLVVLNHPVWNRSFGGAPDTTRDARAVLIEVLGGPSHSEAAAGEAHPDLFHDDVLVLLNQGWRGGFSYGEDDHTGHWGRVSRAGMGTWARARTREALLESLRAGRTFATEDRALSLWLEAGETPMGAEAPLAPTQVRVRAAHASGAVGEVALFLDPDGPGGEPARQVRMVSGGTLDFPLTPDAPGAYVLAVARAEDGARAWASPIWFGPTPQYLPPPQKGHQDAEGPARPVDLNFAGRGALRGVPGLGKSLARRIDEARRAGRLFLSVAALQELPGLTPDEYRKVAPGLRVGHARDSADQLQRSLRGLRGLALDQGKREYLEWCQGRAERLLAVQLKALLEQGRQDRACHAVDRLAGDEADLEASRQRLGDALGTTLGSLAGCWPGSPPTR